MIKLEQIQLDSIITAINSRAKLASPTFTGTPIAPTAVAGTNTTQVATTAFVLANAGSSLANKPAFNAYGTVSANLTSLQKLTHYNTTTYNIGNNYNPSTCTFTAPIAGTYFFRASAWQGPGSTTGGGLGISVNGSFKAIQRNSESSSSYTTLVPGLMVRLNVGDYVEVHIETVTAGGYIHLSSGDGWANFSGHFLGA